MNDKTNCEEENFATKKKDWNQKCGMSPIIPCVSIQN